MTCFPPVILTRVLCKVTKACVFIIRQPHFSPCFNVHKILPQTEKSEVGSLFVNVQLHFKKHNDTTPHDEAALCDKNYLENIFSLNLILYRTKTRYLRFKLLNFRVVTFQSVGGVFDLTFHSHM